MLIQTSGKHVCNFSPSGPSVSDVAWFFNAPVPASAIIFNESPSSRQVAMVQDHAIVSSPLFIRTFVFYASVTKASVAASQLCTH